jgi:hypothetical protein
MLTQPAPVRQLEKPGRPVPENPGPGGSNGTARINSTTLGSDGSADSLTGASGQDWFVVSLEDVLIDLATKNETKTLV